MLSKCANPSCSAIFRYMHEGELFRIEVEAKHDSTSDAEGMNETMSPRRLEYFWLCAGCSARMTLKYSRDSGITAVPRALMKAAS